MSKIFRGQAPGPPFKGDRGAEGEGRRGRAGEGWGGKVGEGREEGKGERKGKGGEGRKGDWMEWEGRSIPPNKILPLHH
jgi:hypothetical protein